MHPNSSSHPAPRVGNINGRRRDIIPDSMGSSQPTPRVGNLSRRRPDVIPDSMGSNQPTSRGGNMDGCTHDVVPADRLSRSVTQQTESGSSNSAESSGHNSSPPPIARGLLARPAKRLRVAQFRPQHILNLRWRLTDKGIWNPSASATIAAMSIRWHIRATKLNRTPNLKERTSVVWMRQHLDVVVGHDWWRHTETIAQGLCEFQPTLVHRRQQLSHGRPRPM